VSWLVNLPGPVFLALLLGAVALITWGWLKFDFWLERRYQAKTTSAEAYLQSAGIHPMHWDSEAQRKKWGQKS
jgi:hypothetical protein